MVVNESDIRAMVTECVSRILEVHGAIDDKLEGLARLIIQKLKTGKDSFVISSKDLARYYPYKNCPQELNVIVTNLGLLRSAAYNISTRTLKISKWALFCDDEYLVEVIMHELTHFINDTESGGLPSPIGINVQNNKEESLRQIAYLFDDSEMQARVSQFKWSLKRGGVSKDDHESVTHLSKMASLIKDVQKETYADYKSSYGQDDAFGTIIEGLLEYRAQYKTNKDKKLRYSELLSEGEFKKAKAAILGRLYKKYKKFISSLSKTIYDFLSQNPSDK